MARVPYVDPSDPPPEVARVFDAQRYIGGRITNFHRIFANIPWVYRWYVPFSQSIIKTGEHGLLDQRTRQLAQIRTSVVNACEYCASHNMQLGSRIGIDEREMAALRGEVPLDEVFGDRDRAIIEWAHAVAVNRARRDQAGFEALRAHLDDQEIVELTVLVAARTMINRIQEALWTDLEDEGELDEATPDAPRGGIDAYVRDVLCPGHPVPPGNDG